MSVDVAAVQEALKAEGLDGWLLYDFRGSNPIAARLAGIGEGGGHLATRRWFYLVPSSATTWITSLGRSRSTPGEFSSSPA